MKTKCYSDNSGFMLLLCGVSKFCMSFEDLNSLNESHILFSIDNSPKFRLLMTAPVYAMALRICDLEILHHVHLAL